MQDDPPPRISVILPTFNRDAYLAAAIDSVLGQTVPIHDFVVVDDGSTNGTRDVVAGYAPHVRYVHQPNGGKIAAIENGLGLIGGEFVWIMDDDDVACPNALAALVAPLVRDDTIVFSYGHLVKFTTDRDGKIVRTEKSLYPTADPRPFLLKFMEDGFITGQPCVLARRTALDTVLPFDRSITASVDYWLHLNMGLIGPTACVDEVVLLQRQHPGARGPLANRYQESERANRWKSSDTVIIGRLLERLMLDAFVPYPASRERMTTFDRRAALVQRGVIAARKQIWTRALEDFAEAFAIEPDDPLTALELRILSGALGCRYGIEEVYNEPEILDCLRALGDIRPREAGIAGQLGRPLLHRMKIAARLRQPAQMRAAFNAWLRLMNLRTGTVAALAALTRLLRRPVQDETSSSSSGRSKPFPVLGKQASF